MIGRGRILFGLAVALAGCESEPAASTPASGDAKAPAARDVEPGAEAPKVPEVPAVPEVPEGPTTVTVEGANVRLGSAESDGQRVVDLACAAPSVPLMGAMALTGSFGTHKAAFDDCAPDGDALVVHWSAGPKGGSKILVAGGTPSARGCVSEVMTKVESPFAAECGAIVLVGDKAGADGALAKLVRD